MKESTVKQLLSINKDGKITEASKKQADEVAESYSLLSGLMFFLMCISAIAFSSFVINDNKDYAFSCFIFPIFFVAFLSSLKAHLHYKEIIFTYTQQG